jgi:hypothetical protein
MKSISLGGVSWWCVLMQFSLSLVSTARMAAAKAKKLITQAAKNRTTHRQSSSLAFRECWHKWVFALRRNYTKRVYYNGWGCVWLTPRIKEKHVFGSVAWRLRCIIRKGDEKGSDATAAVWRKSQVRVGGVTSLWAENFSGQTQWPWIIWRVSSQLIITTRPRTEVELIYQAGNASPNYVYF